MVGIERRQDTTFCGLGCIAEEHDPGRGLGASGILSSKVVCHSRLICRQAMRGRALGGCAGILLV